MVVRAPHTSASVSTGQNIRVFFEQSRSRSSTTRGLRSSQSFSMQSTTWNPHWDSILLRAWVGGFDGCRHLVQMVWLESLWCRKKWKEWILGYLEPSIASYYGPSESFVIDQFRSSVSKCDEGTQAKRVRLPSEKSSSPMYADRSVRYCNRAMRQCFLTRTIHLQRLYRSSLKSKFVNIVDAKWILMNIETILAKSELETSYPLDSLTTWNCTYNIIVIATV